MKIAVIAADGRTGRIFVERALQAGHTIRAGIYREDNFSPHEKLTVVRCDATKNEEMRLLIHEQDAVISFIGHIKGSSPLVQTDAMRVLIQVMETENVSRLVSLTGTGVRFTGDNITLVDRVLNMTIRLIDPARVRDGIEHVAVLKRSTLDWTVLRVLKLQNTRPTAFRLSEHGPTKPYVSRDEVAKAALQVLEKGTFIRQAPILSKK